MARSSRVDRNSTSSPAKKTGQRAPHTLFRRELSEKDVDHSLLQPPAASEYTTSENEERPGHLSGHGVKKSPACAHFDELHPHLEKVYAALCDNVIRAALGAVAKLGEDLSAASDSFPARLLVAIKPAILDIGHLEAVAEAGFRQVLIHLAREDGSLERMRQEAEARLSNETTNDGPGAIHAASPDRGEVGHPGQRPDSSVSPRLSLQGCSLDPLDPDLQEGSGECEHPRHIAGDQSTRPAAPIDYNDDFIGGFDDAPDGDFDQEPPFPDPEIEYSPDNADGLATERAGDSPAVSSAVRHSGSLANARSLPVLASNRKRRADDDPIFDRQVVGDKSRSPTTRRVRQRVQTPNDLRLTHLRQTSRRPASPSTTLPFRVDDVTYTFRVGEDPFAKSAVDRENRQIASSGPTIKTARRAGASQTHGAVLTASRRMDKKGIQEAKDRWFYCCAFLFSYWEAIPVHQYEHVLKELAVEMISHVAEVKRCEDTIAARTTTGRTSDGKMKKTRGMNTTSRLAHNAEGRVRFERVYMRDPPLSRDLRITGRQPGRSRRMAPVHSETEESVVDYDDDDYEDPQQEGSVDYDDHDGLDEDTDEAE